MVSKILVQSRIINQSFPHLQGRGLVVPFQEGREGMILLHTQSFSDHGKKKLSWFSGTFKQHAYTKIQTHDYVFQETENFKGKKIRTKIKILNLPKKTTARQLFSTENNLFQTVTKSVLEFEFHYVFNLIRHMFGGYFERVRLNCCEIRYGQPQKNRLTPRRVA